MKYYTTLKQIKAAGACEDRYNYLIKHLGKWGDDKKIPLKKILDINGIDDAIWALRAVDHPKIKKDIQWFALDCAKRVSKNWRLYKDDDTLDDILSAESAESAAWSAARAAWAARAAGPLKKEMSYQAKLFLKYFCTPEEKK